MKLKLRIFALMAMLLCAFSVNAQVTTEAELSSALTAGGEVTLGADIEVAAPIEIPADKTVVLDLAGYDIIGGGTETKHIYVLKNYGTLTIKDSGTEGKIVSRGVYNYGMLTLESGIIDACDGDGGYAVNNESGSTFIMNGGVVSTSVEDDNKSDEGGYDATALDVPAGCTATLNGGKVTSVCDYTFAISAAGTLNVPATSTVVVEGCHGAISVSGGVTTIEAGTFKVKDDKILRTDNVTYVSGGKLIINGGKFEGDGDTASGCCCVYDEAGGATINGGNFSKSSGGDVWGTTGTTINGGTFENLIETQHVTVGATITNGAKVYTMAENGLEEIVCVAKIGSTTYETLQAAIDAVQNGETIVLMADVTEATVTIEKATGVAFTIDGNYKQFTGKFDLGIGENIVIKNINFVASAEISPDYFIDGFGQNSNSILNITGCTFTDTDYSTTAIGTQQPTNVVIDGCTADGVASLLQNQGGYNITVKNTTIEGKRGISLGSVVGATVEKVTIKAADDKYGIRLNGEITDNTITIKDCDIQAFIPVVVRKASVENYNVVFDGTNTMTAKNTDGLWCAVGTSEYEDNGTMPTDATGKVTVTLNDAGLSEAGVYGNYVPATPVAKVGDVEYTSLQEALNAAAAGTGNVTVTILDNVDLTGVTWTPVTVSEPGYPVVTVEGNNKTITGLTDMLFAGTWAGGSGLIIKNLTIADSEIVNDKDDTKGNVGVGAFIGYPQASATITLENCHLKNSRVEGGHWTGGLIGMAGGYNGNDGPVFMNLTIKGCSVTGSTITGKGSAGGVIGHGSCAAWTNVVIEETTVSGNTITSTGSSTNKAGAVMGTIGAAGQPTTANGETMTGGASVSATVAGNTVTSNGTAITTIYGRQGTATGMLYVAGGSYDKYPIEENVSYAAPIEGYEIVENTDGTFGIQEAKEGLAGTGTAEDPFLINNVDDLVWFQEKVDEQAADGSTQFAGKYFKLTADIDLAGINWNPIGSMSGDHGSFKGVFDGGDHTISNLNVEQAGNGIGLFARTAGNAVIKNLKLNNVTVKSTDNSNYVGGVVGNAYASTKIENVHVSGNVYISGRGYIGGIAGHGYVVMDNVSVVATGDGQGNGKGLVTSTFWCAGGVLGYAGEGATNIMNAKVENVVVTSAAGGLGAIVGMAEDNNGTQPISGSNLSASNVEIKTYTGAYGDSYSNYALGYLYGGNPTSKLTGELKVENVAITTSNGVAPEVNDAVASIDGAIYFNLASAVAAADGKTITMLRNVELASPIAISGKTITLDLGEYTILDKSTTVLSSEDNVWALIDVKSGANLTVCGNGTIKCNYTNETATTWTGMAYAINVDATSKLTVKGGNFINGNGGIQTRGEVVIDGGTFVSHNGGTCIMATYEDAKVTVNAGTFKDAVEASDTYTGSGAIWAGFGAAVEIKGGTYDFAADPEHGNVVWTLFPAQNAIAGTGENAKMTVSGGTFKNFNPATDVIVDYSQSTGFAFGSVVADGYAALPDLNGNYVVGVKPTATVNNLGMTTVAAGDYMVYGNGDNTADMPLSFVMQFLADQTEADMATSPYADWYGDFVITFTGIENGSFTADGCYLAGHYGSFGWVKVPVDGMAIENGVRYPVMLGVGMGQKYDYICSSVQDFKCALYLTPEILAANPNIQVKLELAVVDNASGEDAAKSAIINNENVYSVTDYTYDAEDFVVEEPVPTSVIITISSIGVATYSSPYALDFSAVEGLKAYSAASYNSTTGVVTMLRVNTTPEETGIFLMGAPGEYEVPIIEVSYDHTMNLLVGTVEATQVDGTTADGKYANFKYTSLGDASDPSTYKFHRYADGSTNGAGKAYLQLPINWIKSNASKSISMRFDDGFATDINEIESEMEDGVCYDLSGRRVEEPVKGGIYILNGKKVIY